MLLDTAHPQNVATLARHARADGEDLLGVAGGDGTQALADGVELRIDLGRIAERTFVSNVSFAACLRTRE
ncbi:hypothetical protein [Streptomyces sp. NPDC005485]|uniref:hypothetical protein n=1 Tax=Streptomyces sp. NPDC005485 TaxID=3155591 RepID=UPI0033B6A683